MKFLIDIVYLKDIIAQYSETFQQGAIISVTENHTRIRKLPI